MLYNLYVCRYDMDKYDPEKIHDYGMLLTGYGVVGCDVYIVPCVDPRRNRKIVRFIEQQGVINVRV